MSKVWSIIRGYILWSYDRGTIQYDVMVTLILIFVFFSPYWINFKDKPAQHVAHQTGVIVSPDGQGGFIFQIEAQAVHAKDEAGIRGEVSIKKVDVVNDRPGHVQYYKVWAERE